MCIANALYQWLFLLPPVTSCYLLLPFITSLDDYISVANCFFAPIRHLMLKGETSISLLHSLYYIDTSHLDVALSISNGQMRAEYALPMLCISGSSSYLLLPLVTSYYLLVCLITSCYLSGPVFKHCQLLLCSHLSFQP